MPTCTKRPFLIHATQTLVTLGLHWMRVRCALHAHPLAAFFEGCAPWYGQSGETNMVPQRFRNSHKIT